MYVGINRSHRVGEPNTERPNVTDAWVPLAKGSIRLRFTLHWFDLLYNLFGNKSTTTTQQAVRQNLQQIESTEYEPNAARSSVRAASKRRARACGYAAALEERRRRTFDAVVRLLTLRTATDRITPIRRPL